VLRYAIAFALRRSRKIVRGLKEGLIEDERYAVADHAVAQRGDPWRLNEENAGGEAAIDMTEIRVGRKASPAPQPRLPFLSPGLSGRGLILFSTLTRDLTDQ
jgi:hypothetical protein